MTFKGSIVIKKTDLIDLIQNQKAVFRAPQVSKDSKDLAWGQQISYEMLLEGGWSWKNWDAFMQVIWDYRGDNSWFANGIRWLFKTSNGSET